MYKQHLNSLDLRRFFVSTDSQQDRRSAILRVLPTWWDCDGPLQKTSSLAQDTLDYAKRSRTTRAVWNGSLHEAVILGLLQRPRWTYTIPMCSSAKLPVNLSYTRATFIFTSSSSWSGGKFAYCRSAFAEFVPAVGTIITSLYALATPALACRFRPAPSPP